MDDHEDDDEPVIGSGPMPDFLRNLRPPEIPSRPDDQAPPRWTLGDAQDVARISAALHGAVGFDGMAPEVYAAFVRLGDRVRGVTQAAGGEAAARAALGLPPRSTHDAG